MAISALSQYALSTRNRPLRLILDPAYGSPIFPLMPQHVTGHEDICGGFEFRILCVAESATLALKDFIGMPAELQIVTDRGQLRRLCGIVTSALSGQSDGGLATYQLVMRDALSLMESRVNTRIFRNKSELDIVETIIAEWRGMNSVLASSFALVIDAFQSSTKQPKREFTMQHNESDAAFLRRLMQRRGLAWFFRAGLPDRAGPNGPEANQAIGHSLVIFEDPYRLHESTAGKVRFHRDAATEQRDSITYWAAERTLQPGKSSLHSWDYKNPRGAPLMTMEAHSQANQGEIGNRFAASLENYHVDAPHLGDSIADLTTLGDIQMARFDYASKSFHGEGGIRDLAVGEWISLAGHPEIDTHPEKERQFVITEQRIVARNNLPVDIAARVEQMFRRNGWGDDAASDPSLNAEKNFLTRFSCVRRGIPIVPPRPELPRPRMQTAIVVGPANEEVWCDAMARVKIRFPSARPEDHAHAGGVGAAGLDSDSAWVRVATNWAGNGPGSAGQCGARLLPPVGTEVLVDWMGGDPDKPVIVGQLYNAAAPPPAFRQEAALPATRFQSGLRSREIKGQRGNQLRFDDTPAQINAQLASDHGATELNLGYLTGLRTSGKAEPRGEGAELRTEEAIALHGARGILLSAWKLLGGAGSKRSHLAREDFLGLLRDCGELCGSLGSYAAQHNGVALDATEQDDLLARFKQWEHGSNTAPDVAEPGEPVIGVTSSAGIGFASSKTIVSYSAKNIDSVAQQHLQVVAGQRIAVTGGKGVSLFAQHGGVSAIAHFGKLVLQSQHDDTTIDSAKNMQLTACDGVMTVSAKVIHMVAEDGSFIKLGDGEFIIGSKNPMKFRAPDFLYDGAETMPPVRPDFGGAVADQKFQLRYPDSIDQLRGAFVENASMNVAMSDGTTSAARSGSEGKSELLAREAMHMAEVDVLRGAEE